jgi:transcriptional regulator with XRE-family HTH domain
MPGNTIKQFREFRNYSQDFIAKKMGISQNAYSKIENNITQLTVTHIKQLSKILDISIPDLLQDEYEIRKPNSIPNDKVSRKEIILFIHELQQNFKLKKKDEHILYGAILSILKAASDISEGID